MELRVPLSAPDVTAAEIDAVVQVLRTPRLALGPRLALFEECVAKVAGTRFGVAVNSGTSGLHLCCESLGLGPGDEVITTPFSFVASANAVLHAGATPVFVDVERESLNLDPERIEAALTPRTRAILPVHVFGRPADMDAIGEIASRHRLAVVEDACEALGAVSSGQPAGSRGEAGVFAFYPNKQITTGEGGVVVTDRLDLAERMRSLRNQGRGPGGDDWFEHAELGWSYRLSELSAALGAAQTQRLDEILLRRDEVAAAYAQRLADDPRLRLPDPHVPGGRHAWFAYSVRLRAPLGRRDRDRIFRGLLDRGIGCGRYFAPIHLQPVYRKRFGSCEGDHPVCEAEAGRSLALPFFNRITKAQLDEVCAALRSLLPR